MTRSVFILPLAILFVLGCVVLYTLLGFGGPAATLEAAEDAMNREDYTRSAVVRESRARHRPE